MVCISCRASTSIIFPAVVRASCASRRQWSASYLGCTDFPHLQPPVDRTLQLRFGSPSRNFKIGYGTLLGVASGVRTINLKALQELRTHEQHPCTKLITPRASGSRSRSQRGRVELGS